MAIERVVIAVVIASTLISMASAAPGTATFYQAYPTACYGNQNQGTMVTAVSRILFNNRATCGRSVRVRCTRCFNQATNPCRSGEVTVKIVDLCLGCSSSQLDLSQEAFSRIANPVAREICIDYTLI